MYLGTQLYYVYVGSSQWIRFRQSFASHPARVTNRPGPPPMVPCTKLSHFIRRTINTPYLKGNSGLMNTKAPTNSLRSTGRLLQYARLEETRPTIFITKSYSTSSNVPGGRTYHCNWLGMCKGSVSSVLIHSSKECISSYRISFGSNSPIRWSADDMEVYCYLGNYFANMLSTGISTFS
jgi:hypothetical protein